jgi:energy-converting hydrogenase Eha subunit G
MNGLVYILCGATCLLCSCLLLRGYWQTSVRLLLWSGLCFLGLMADNVMLYIDLIVVPDVDLAVWRKAPGFVAIALLVFGLVWESK